MDDTRKAELLKSLVAVLCAERGYEPPRTEGPGELWTTFRALVNTRPPIPAGDGWLAMQDELLQGMIAEAGVSTIADAVPSPADAQGRGISLAVRQNGAAADLTGAVVYLVWRHKVTGERGTEPFTAIDASAGTFRRLQTR